MRSEGGSLELHSIGFSQGLHWKKRRASEKRTQGGKLQPASLENKILCYKELGSHPFPNLERAERRVRGQGFPTHSIPGHKALCWRGREEQGYATLALPSVALLSGSGDAAARGLLRVLWQDCYGSWENEADLQTGSMGGRPEVWGGRYGGRAPGKSLPEQQTGVGLAPFSSACKEAETLAWPYLRSSITSHLQPVLLGDIGGSSGQMEGGHCAQGTRMGRSNGRAS